MEGTHTLLSLHQQIEEFSHIGPYIPTKRVRGFSYRNRNSHDYQTLNTKQHDQSTEDPAGWKQRRQSFKTADDVSRSCRATNAALDEIHRLSVEHRQLLVDLLSLCGDCASRLKMGNQDGTLEEDRLVHDVISSDLQCVLTLSPDRRISASRVRKSKKPGGKTKMTNKGTTEDADKLDTRTLVREADNQMISGTCASIYAQETIGPSLDRSSNSVNCETLFPMEETFNSTQEGWDFMEDSCLFESEIDLCCELTEFEDQFSLSYGTSCPLIEDMKYHSQHPGDNPDVRPSTKHPTSPLRSNDINVRDMSSGLSGRHLDHDIVLLSEQGGHKVRNGGPGDQPKVSTQGTERNGNHRGSKITGE